MPRVPDSLLNSVIYLYPSPTPQRGKGASGFITSVVEEGYTHLYAVTCCHVITGELSATPAPCVHIFATGEMLEFRPHDWIRWPEADLAVCSLDGKLNDQSRLFSIPRSMYVSANPELEKLNIGVGDDVFMIGRFFPSEKHGVDAPVLRFGNISVWPARSITVDYGLSGEKIAVEIFLVEMRSRNGYSGSPVFFSVEPGSKRPIQQPPSGLLPFFTVQLQTYGFLGVDRGHLKDKVEDKKFDTPMALVVADRKLVELLDQPGLIDARKSTRESAAPDARRRLGSSVRDQT